MNWRALAERVAGIPAVNTHVHARGHNGCQPMGEVMPFLKNLYVDKLLPFTDAALAALLNDQQLDDRERWGTFLHLWPFVRHTGFGEVVRRILDNWGIAGDLSERTYDEVLERLQNRSPKMSRRACADAGITHAISNIIGHSDLEWQTIEEFLSGGMTTEPGWYDLLSTVPLHTFKTHADILNMEAVSRQKIGSLSDMEKAVDDLLARAATMGIVGLKNHCAYRRGLDIGPVDRVRAERELAALLRGEEGVDTLGLSDALFHRIVQRAIDHDLPIAVHTGMLAASADPRANVALMAGVFEAYPAARFDLYHLNYPWTEDLIAVLKRFPNTWANCAWTHVVDPHGTVEFLRRAVGTIPANHIFGFGGDSYILPEPVVAHLHIARRNIAVALSGAVEVGMCSSDSCIEIARLWLHENPREFYRLPSESEGN